MQKKLSLCEIGLFLLLTIVGQKGHRKNKSIGLKYYIPINNSVSIKTAWGDGIGYKNYSPIVKHGFSIYYNGNRTGKIQTSIAIYYDRCVVEGPEFGVESERFNSTGSPDFFVFTRVDMSELGLSLSFNELVFKKGRNSLRVGGGIRVHLYPKNLVRREIYVSHFYGENQDNRLLNFPELAKNKKVINHNDGIDGLNFLGTIAYYFDLTEQFSMEVSNSYFYTRYLDGQGVSSKDNVFAKDSQWSASGASLAYTFKQQFNFGFEIGVNFKF
ncbi:MAG: hypothetical protein IPQ03_05895 [Bacteroidetes bacterium]|nr:hypothetical protein [Bacteroidota bacterium]